MTILDTWFFDGSSELRPGLAGRVVVAPDPFALWITRPQLKNTGPDPTVVRHAWTPADGGVLNETTNVITVSVTGTQFFGVDFGNYRVKPTGANITFSNCTWLIEDGSTGNPCIDCRSSTHSNVYIFRCDLNTRAQNNWNNGIIGDRFTLEQSRVQNFVDLVNFYPHSSNLDGPLNVKIIGNYLAFPAFFWNPATGVIHPSDTKTHNDVIQGEGGRGAIIQGNFIWAYYSTTIGTGTPGSGSEYGWVDVPYTQAEGEAKRQEIVYGNGTIPSGLGGSITGIMFNNDRGGTPVVDVSYNWGGGGSYWLNAGETWTAVAGITYNFGTIHDNIIIRDQRVLSPVTGGLPVVFGINSTGTANVFDNYEANPDWTKNLSKIIERQNA